MTTENVKSCSSCSRPATEPVGLRVLALMILGPFMRGRDPLCGSCALVRLLRGVQGLVVVVGLCLAVLGGLKDGIAATLVVVLVAIILIWLAEKAIRAEAQASLRGK